MEKKWLIWGMVTTFKSNDFLSSTDKIQNYKKLKWKWNVSHSTSPTWPYSLSHSYQLPVQKLNVINLSWIFARKVFPHSWQYWQLWQSFRHCQHFSWNWNFDKHSPFWYCWQFWYFNTLILFKMMREAAPPISSY